MHKLWLIFFTLCKWSWQLLDFIRKFTINAFVISVIFLLISIYLPSKYKSPAKVKGALVVDLIGNVVDKTTTNNKFQQLGHELFSIFNNQLQENSIFDLIYKLRQAKVDNNITGIVLSLKNFTGTDQTSLQYIGKALLEFRNSGKPIYAVSDSYSQEQYFLASYANKIYLTPQGVVDLHGIAINKFYYKILLDKLKINSHIFRIGTYKSAVEPFLRNNMSNDARKVDTRWVNQLWYHYLMTVSANRQITKQQLFPGALSIIDGLHKVRGDTAKFALNKKWVDKLASYSEINDELVSVFGWNNSEKTFNKISIYDYNPVKSKLHCIEKIAVIFANGTIIDGIETPGFVGSDTTVRQIRHAKLNPDIKAIIFRVNSPGGSVTASEVIRSELEAARLAGKLIIVSMGGMAASGGYWISTPADYIIASTSTLTGSIGVFGIINTLENSLDSIGIHTDGIATSPLADISVTKTLPSEVSKIMKLRIENNYYNFIKLVAKSRHKTLKEVDNISQGRVWIGSDALKNGLVDKLGDFDDAVNKAAELSKVKQYQLYWYIEKPGLLNLISTQIITLIYATVKNFIQSFLLLTNIQEAEQLNTNNILKYNCNNIQNYYAFCSSCKQIVK